MAMKEKKLRKRRVLRRELKTPLEMPTTGPEPYPDNGGTRYTQTSCCPLWLGYVVTREFGNFWKFIVIFPEIFGNMLITYVNQLSPALQNDAVK